MCLYWYIRYVCLQYKVIIIFKNIPFMLLKRFAVFMSLCISNKVLLLVFTPQYNFT